MIQFNLLPDVKLEYVKAQRVKHTVISAAMLSAGSAFVIFLLLFLVVNVVQKKSMGDLNNDIKKYNLELKQTPDLDKILTIQSQLSALPELHGDKVAASRTFRFVQQFTPADVKLSDVVIDYDANTFSLTGETTGLDKVNTFVDTIKFTKYVDENADEKNAFSDVVLSQFSRTATATTYTITFTYDTAIYNNSEDVNLIIPNTVSTRSVIAQPTDLFEKPTTNPETTN